MVSDSRDGGTYREWSKEYYMHAAFCMPAKSCYRQGNDYELKDYYPGANITAIDYDPGASEVNQLNRIKLMLSVAFKNLKYDANDSAIDEAVSDRELIKVQQGDLNVDM
jgi:predicted nucleotide-binding protein (sugar kinase/HSP70/actin superfamily)